MPKNNTEKLDRRKLLSSMLIGGLTLPSIGQSHEDPCSVKVTNNSLL